MNNGGNVNTILLVVVIIILVGGVVFWYNAYGPGAPKQQDTNGLQINLGQTNNAPQQ